MGGTTKIIRNFAMPRSAFGDQRVVLPQPVIQMLPQYELIGDDVETFSATGGTITSSNNQYCVFSGTSVGGYGVLRSKRPIVYKTGVGILARFTARFGMPAELSTMRAGLFQATDALMFGYNGLEFGVLYEHHGVLEIQELQVTAAAGVTESLTVTVNGTGHTFNVTGTTVEDNAQEIAVELEANIDGWKFDAIGDTVRCMYETTEDATGAFSFVNNTGGGTCAASFSEVVAGQAKTTEWIAQKDWNLNKAKWLKPQNGTPFFIAMQYLGYGGITFGVEEPKTGDFVPVHRVQYASTSVTPTLANPSMKLGIVAASLGGTTDVHAHTASMVAATDGPNVIARRGRGASNTKNLGATANNVLSLKCRRTYNKKAVVGEILPSEIEATTDSTKGAIIEVWIDPVMNGTANYTFVDENSSIAVTDTAATTISTNGRLIAAFSVGSGGSNKMDLAQLGEYILPGEVMVVTGRVISGADSDITVSINWREDF